MNVGTVNFNNAQRFSRFDFNSTQQFCSYNIEQPKKASPGVKAASAIFSLAGAGTVLTLIAKRQGFPISPKVLKNTPLKEWFLFKIPRKTQLKEPLYIEEREIMELAAGSVAGGLIAGALFDKNNMKAKGREALTQIAGNVFVPVAFVGAISRLYKSNAQKINSFIPTVKMAKDSTSKTINKALRALPPVVLTGVALAAGIFTGSKVTNFINEKFFGQKHERKIKTTDFAPHVDDLCLAITLMGSKDSVISGAITRSIPLFLSVPGYQVGKAQD